MIERNIPIKLTFVFNSVWESVQISAADSWQLVIKYLFISHIMSNNIKGKFWCNFKVILAWFIWIKLYSLLHQSKLIKTTLPNQLSRLLMTMRWQRYLIHNAIPLKPPNRPTLIQNQLRWFYNLIIYFSGFKLHLFTILFALRGYLGTGGGGRAVLSISFEFK